MPSTHHAAERWQPCRPHMRPLPRLGVPGQALDARHVREQPSWLGHAVRRCDSSWVAQGG
jgi:hypothetical protein